MSGRGVSRVGGGGGGGGGVLHADNDETCVTP